MLHAKKKSEWFSFKLLCIPTGSWHHWTNFDSSEGNPVIQSDKRNSRENRCTRDTDVLAYSDGLQSAPTHSLHHTLSTLPREPTASVLRHEPVTSPTAPSVQQVQCKIMISFSLSHTHACRDRDRERDLVQCFKSSTTEEIDFALGN